MRFYLGTHHPEWLAQSDVPLFVSRRQLVRRKAAPVARGPWALDSGGFTEISQHGRWTVEPARYAAEVERIASESGNLDWAAIQDWMCEPHILAKTGRTVEEHQRLTIESYLTLRELAPSVPWAPVLQGWATGDYRRHVRAYEAAGVDLKKMPAVGVGSVCRRQNTTSAILLLNDLRGEGLENLHGFGFKVGGLVALKNLAEATGRPLALASADSLAWSYHARREARPFYATCTHKNCANCLPFALSWRGDLVARLERAA